MSNTTEINDLVIACEDGEETIENLYVSRPQLVPMIKEKLVAVRAMNWMDETLETSPATPQSSFESGTKLGRYKLIEVIGQGGFGEVWRANDPHLDRYVAIKVLRTERTSPKHIQAFQAEGQRVAKLRHSNIISVFDIGQQEGRWFLVSELIEGKSLADQLADQLSLEEILVTISQISKALHYAHSLGIVHRDVKPSNIILDDQGKSYLADFGISVSIEGVHIDSPSAIGTLAYMAPELLRGCSGSIPDQRCDIYSLGMVMYETLTGNFPYHSDSPIKLRKLIIDQEPSLPSSLNENLPQGLDAVCLKALEKNPSKRFSTAEEFGDALEKFI